MRKLQLASNRLRLADVQVRTSYDDPAGVGLETLEVAVMTEAVHALVASSVAGICVALIPHLKLNDVLGVRLENALKHVTSHLDKRRHARLRCIDASHENISCLEDDGLVRVETPLTKVAVRPELGHFLA